MLSYFNSHHRKPQTVLGRGFQESRNTHWVSGGLSRYLLALWLGQRVQAVSCFDLIPATLLRLLTERKEATGRDKEKIRTCLKVTCLPSPLPIHHSLNHRMVENLVNGKGEFQLRHNLCRYSVSWVQCHSLLKLITLLLRGGPKQTDLYLSILFLVTYFLTVGVTSGKVM